MRGLPDLIRSSWCGTCGITPRFDISHGVLYIRLVRLWFGVNSFHRWLNAYLLWSLGPIRVFDGKLGSRALRALSIPATGNVPASSSPS